jgi:predicted transcriptional regulator
VLQSITLSSSYLKSITCYDILPINSKLIYFEASLLVKKALYALLQNGIRSAPLWDQTERKLMGLITATDFLNLMLYFYKTKTSYDQVVEEMDILTIKKLRGLNECN